MVHTMKFLIVELSPLPILIPLGSKYPPQDPVFKYSHRIRFVNSTVRSPAIYEACRKLPSSQVGGHLLLGDPGLRSWSLNEKQLILVFLFYRIIGQTKSP